MSPKSRAFWLWCLPWLLVDQVTKLWIYFNLAEGPRGDVIVVIPGWLDLVHAENPGAAFSMFANFEYRHLFFLVVFAVAAWIVRGEYRRLADKDVWPAVALGLIASGAAGNAVDRAWKRTVTDFVRLHVDLEGPRNWLVQTFGTNEWPSFNVADSTLLVGVILYVFVGGEKKAKAAPPEAPPEEQAA